MALTWMDADKNEPPETSLLLVVEERDGKRVAFMMTGFYADGEYAVGEAHSGCLLPDDKVVRFWALPNWPDGYDDAGCWQGTPATAG